MLPYFRRPGTGYLQSLLAQQNDLPLTYSHVGQSLALTTASDAPPGFTVDINAIALGQGADVFLAAQESLRDWQQFGLTWVGVYPDASAIRLQQPIAVVARFAGLWWVNACQIVSELPPIPDEHLNQQAVPKFPGVTVERQFGFACGTLPQHAGIGEERFRISIDRNQQVYFDIIAFSRPASWLTWIAYPLMRQLQKRFARESMQAMQNAVNRSQQN